MKLGRLIAALVIAGSFAQPGVAASTGLKLIAEQPGTRPPAYDRAWPAVVTHTHNWRFPAGETSHTSFDEAERELVEWCRKLGVRAVGVGSAWNPENDANFQRFEGPDRDLYYSGRFDQKSVMDAAGIHRLLAMLNSEARGATLFYLDNETPKSSMGHVWWFGYLYDFPAWHDYSQDRPIHYFDKDPSLEINPLTGEPHTRRSLFEIMAIQRKAGALGIFAHPTRWWLSDGKFVTNIAAMAGVFLMADGYLDGMAVMGDQVYNKSYQDLWFSFLDTGDKTPGFAETDFFLNLVNRHTKLDTFRNYPHIGDRELTEQNIRDTARTGEVFFSNGGFVNISVDGVPMGSVCRTAPDKRHKLRIEVYPPENERLGRIEIVGKHGEVIASKDDFGGGVLEYELPGKAEPDYVVVRAFGAGDDPEHNPDHVKYLAVSNPVYLWPQRFQPMAARTACTLRVADSSKWNGGWIEFQTGDGGFIAKEKISPGVIRKTVPASSRIVLSKAGIKSRMFYIAMENLEVEKDISYLRFGEFRKDYPNLPLRVVPPEAFHLAHLRQALSSFDYELQ